MSPGKLIDWLNSLRSCRDGEQNPKEGAPASADGGQVRTVTSLKWRRSSGEDEPELARERGPVSSEDRRGYLETARPEREQRTNTAASSVSIRL
jgi:hypothetical protein